ncbi:hypothetical protein [Simkania sp.]|uniref:hypothetical protein n=1 Tax=Simkania sp. TaxID=34094 RepID=UPI003B526DD7
MATKNYHVGVDDRSPGKVRALIEQWDPTQKKAEPEPELTLRQKINQHIDAIPTWIKTSFFAAIFIAEVALIFKGMDHCASWYGTTSYSTPAACKHVVNFISWCAQQPYCKPLVQTIGWLR